MSAYTAEQIIAEMRRKLSEYIEDTRHRGVTVTDRDEHQRVVGEARAQGRMEEIFNEISKRHHALTEPDEDYRRP